MDISRFVFNFQGDFLDISAGGIGDFVLSIGVKIRTPEELLKNHINIFPCIVPELIKTQQIYDILK